MIELVDVGWLSPDFISLPIRDEIIADTESDPGATAIG
jgi:hypothetical protein